MAAKSILDRTALQVIVLARGRGERLRPFTLGRPKALCTICNVSMLGRLLADLAEAGFPSVTLSLPSPLPLEWEHESRRLPRNMEIVPAVADKPAAGSFIAVRQCLNGVSDRILVIYGDSFLRANLLDLVRRHARYNRQYGAAATVLYHRPADRFTPDHEGRTYHGIMRCALGGQVTRFLEKPPVSLVRSGFDLANAAVFVVERSIFEGRRFAEAEDFSRHFFEPAVNRHLATVYATFIGRTGYRCDLGTPERLFEANMRVLSSKWAASIPGRESPLGVWMESGITRRGARVVPPVAVGRGVRLAAGSSIGPMAVVGEGSVVGHGASVRHSVLMARTGVGENASVDGCIVGCDSFISKGVVLPPGSLLGDFSRLGNGDEQD